MNTELTPIHEALAVAQDVFHRPYEHAHADPRHKDYTAVTAGGTPGREGSTTSE